MGGAARPRHGSRPVRCGLWGKGSRGVGIGVGEYVRFTRGVIPGRDAANCPLTDDPESSCGKSQPSQNGFIGHAARLAACAILAALEADAALDARSNNAFVEADDDTGGAAFGGDGRYLIRGS